MKRKKSVPELAGIRVPLSFRQHLLPPLLGITIMLTLIGFFNSQFLIAKLSGLTYKPVANAAVLDQAHAASPLDPSKSQITINNIGVQAPLILSENKIDETRFQLALRNGVVHYPDTALPGQAGNIVLFGHSSGQAWAPGSYKFILSHLDRLQKDNKIFIEYDGTRYIYNVTSTRVVLATDVSVLNPTQDNMLTLITCYPVGTNQKRLIVTAKQIVPQPAPLTANSAKAAVLTEINVLPDSQAPSFWDSLQEFFR